MRMDFKITNIDDSLTQLSVVVVVVVVVVPS